MSDIEDTQPGVSTMEIAAAAKAATNSAILSTKNAIRNFPELSEHRRNTLCGVIDSIYLCAFSDGALWMGMQATEIFKA